MNLLQVITKNNQQLFNLNILMIAACPTVLLHPNQLEVHKVIVVPHSVLQ